jgi:glycosyltransferase involved in cell wall biosynthesis
VEVAARGCDVLFAPVASACIPFLDTDRPVAYLSDATFRLLRRYYPDVASLPPHVAAQRDELEARAIARAELLVYPSTWAAASAIADYGAPPQRVRVIDFGPNLDDVPGAAEALARPWGGPCHLLFLGRDWHRKGGDIALEALDALRGLGLEATLTICGSQPPDRTTRPGMRVEPLLDKRRPRDRARLRRLLREAHFLILPTRADCYSMVACEASAFGLPVVTAATGGVPSAVHHGENGLLLSPEAGGEAYARAIADVFAVERAYRALVRSARTAHETRLNWRTWGTRMRRELHALAGGHP